MIVRAGGVTLRAPDVMPPEAAPAVASLGMLSALADVAVSTGHPHTDFSSAWASIATLEVIAFGRRHAGRLRRCGPAARKSASRQLLDGWAVPCR